MTYRLAPLGALVAGIFLGSALTVLAFALRGLDRAIASIGDSVLPALVEGLREWLSIERPGDDATSSKPVRPYDLREGPVDWS